MPRAAHAMSIYLRLLAENAQEALQHVDHVIDLKGRPPATFGGTARKLPPRTAELVEAFEIYPEF